VCGIEKRRARERERERERGRVGEKEGERVCVNVRVRVCDRNEVCDEEGWAKDCPPHRNQLDLGQCA
jgi:hypothetical protein